MDDRLSNLTTHLSQMGTPDYFVRYVPAIHRYALGVLRDEDAADEVSLVVCELLLDKDEKQWQPGSGRFRDYLKQLVRRAADKWRKKRQRSSRKFAGVDPDQLSDPAVLDTGLNAALVELIRERLRLHSMEDLHRHQEEQRQRGHDNSDYDAVEIMMNNPGLDQRSVADLVAVRLGRVVATGKPQDDWDKAVRKRIGKARRKFAEIVLCNFTQIMDNLTAAELEDELQALGMWVFISEFLPDDWDSKWQFAVLTNPTCLGGRPD